MISSITIKGIASYKEEASLITDKKINLIYGLNGTGKTTLSNFLKDKNHSKFNKCEVKGGDTAKLLVYNQEFINENFYERDDLKGVFTVSTENAIAEENIKNAKKEIERLKSKEILKNDELEKIQEKIKDKRTATTKKIWEIKTTFSGGDKILDYCLEGVKGSKDSLFDHIRLLDKPTIKPTKTTDELKKEIAKIEGDEATEMELLSKIVLDEILTIEDEPIFSEVIIGNENSSVSSLIQELRNSDWVKQGLSYIPKEINEPKNCPFCQQKTITDDLAKEIKNYFDKTYEDKISKIKSFEESYKTIKNNIPKLEYYLQNTFDTDKKVELRSAYEKLVRLLSGNIKSIQEKIKSPSGAKILKSSKIVLDECNDLVEVENSKIRKHNENIKNKKIVKDKIKKEFWEIVRWEYDTYISSFEVDTKKLKKEESKIDEALKKITNNIKTQNDIIKSNQDKTINIEKAIESINYQLVLLGLYGFEIKPHEGNFYRIVREDESKPEFQSLSEGEKMIISFLYFIELCKGKENKDETVTDKIVVIDDPISSLSHNYIFNIAQLIKNSFFDSSDYLQIFVMTHSMYFFHELCKLQKQKDRKLFRIVKKSNKSSSVLEMQSDEILNDYQAYWKILKDHEDGNAHDSILANAMRNILEHFFAFIDNEKMKEAIKKLDAIEYGAFLRYMDRESHSDQTNISDIKEIDIELFKNAFKKVFEHSDNIQHYNKMMEL
ncbi:MAG: AAA family ATPase [Sulfurovum sp.]|nr:AAA family ATPase [Sulfurovum sp.]